MESKPPIQIHWNDRDQRLVWCHHALQCHLDRFSCFAGLAGVPNTQTTDRATRVAIGSINARWRTDSLLPTDWRSGRDATVAAGVADSAASRDERSAALDLHHPIHQSFNRPILTTCPVTNVWSGHWVTRCLATLSCLETVSKQYFCCLGLGGLRHRLWSCRYCLDLHRVFFKNATQLFFE